MLPRMRRSGIQTGTQSVLRPCRQSESEKYTSLHQNKFLIMVNAIDVGF
jgi:hypothetical protein